MVSIASRVLPVSDRRFFTNIALVMAAVAFAGFARTYYLAGLHDAPGPTLTPAVHVHGALCTAWILLLIVQTRLIAAGRREVHKSLGIAGVAVAAATVITGLLVAISSQRRVHTPVSADTLADPYVFLIFPTASVGMFALFVLLGVLQRRRADAHKRLMLLATANLLIPAMARIVMQTTPALGIRLPGVVGAVLLLNLFLIALAVHDYRTRGKLHPVTLWGGALIVISEPLRFLIGFSAPWQAFARVVMG